MAGRRHKKDKKDRVPIAQRKVYIPWMRQGFRFEPLPPKVPQSVLDNAIDSLAIRRDPKTYKVRVEAFIIECLYVMNRTPPTSNLMGERKDVQAAYYISVLAAQDPTAELPAEGPDLRKIHWTTIALLIHVYATARREFLDQADEEKQRMVYKKNPQQQHKQQSAQLDQALAANEKKKSTADDSGEEDSGHEKGAMVVEPDTDDERLFVKQRPHFDPDTQTKQELKFIALMDEWIQHVDAARGLALSNQDIEAMELF